MSRDAFPSLTPRGLSRTQAAAFVGLSPAAFDAARKKGVYPGPTLPGKRYDRCLFEIVMNRFSGLRNEAGASEEHDPNPWDQSSFRRKR